MCYAVSRLLHMYGELSKFQLLLLPDLASLLCLRGTAVRAVTHTVGLCSIIINTEQYRGLGVQTPI